MRQRRTRKGPKFSEASRLLWFAIAERRWKTILTATHELGLAVGQLARLLYGDRGPARKTAELLRERLGIPLIAWDQAPTQPFKIPTSFADLLTPPTPHSRCAVCKHTKKQHCYDAGDHCGAKVQRRKDSARCECKAFVQTAMEPAPSGRSSSIRRPTKVAA